MRPMETEEEDSGGWDFLDWLGPDTSTTVFHLLDDPADLARVGAVSRSWRRFVIENGFSKRLCRRICPEAASFTRAVVVTRSPPPAASASASESSQDAECRAREGEHAAYSYLLGVLVSAKPAMDLIMRCVGASSTDFFPDESMENTLVPHEWVNHRHSYWSSGGKDDPDAPESLTYRLSSDLCLIDEIRVRPYKAAFQNGHPIYSSKAVRIRLGHSKLDPGTATFVSAENENLTAIADENYTWTYTSPEFPMLQENVLQTFKLPRPALCIGGIVKIELLGRLQKQSTDDRYYICVCHVQVMGRSLSPDLMIDISDPADYSNLKYLPGAGNLRPEDLLSSDAKEDSSDWRSLVSRYRQVRELAMVYMLLGPVQFVDEQDEAEGDLLHML
ncbi:F-box protein At4g00755-like isoform X1 [Miscanthus floridulus]|uniref:F-box protein At4g00755-like isoform X1 n=1 Tax=Miscanthus floridulus TaxID=154761 RepID=UPI0034587B4B